MVDQYLVGETKQESFEGYSDALSQIFNIAINILLGTAVITGKAHLVSQMIHLFLLELKR